MEINDYPKSKKLLQEYIKKVILEKIGQLNLPELEKLDYGIIEQLVIEGTHDLLVNNPRFLYDFFDEKNIFITIHSTKKDEWFFRVNWVEGSDSYSDRLSTEKIAFEKAFKILEDEK